MGLGRRSSINNAIKLPARAGTTAALPANTATTTTLTANANGALAAQDGVTMVVGDRLLVKNEGTASKNGIYSVTSLGSVGTPWVLTRTPDFDSSTTVIAGTIVVVAEGTTLADTLWELATNNPITVGTTALSFVLFGGVASVTGVGNTNRLPLWTNGAGRVLGDSWLLQSGSDIRIDAAKRITASDGTAVAAWSANDLTVDINGSGGTGYMTLQSDYSEFSQYSNVGQTVLSVGTASPISISLNKNTTEVLIDGAPLRVTGLVKAGSTPVTLTDAAGKILSAALNTVAVANGGTGLTTFGGVNTLLYTTAANTLSSIATAISGVLVTSGGGVPSINTDIPGTVTIGTSYIYRVGGNDVAVADGGTGLSTIGGANTLLYTTAADAISSIATAANGILITSAGGVPSISSTLPSTVQSNITALGTVASGIWNGTVVGATYGGTGVNNGTNTITINTNPATFTFSGAFTLTVPATGTAVLGTGVNTRVSYWSGTNTLTSASNFIFDGTSLIVNGTGTATGEILSVQRSANSSTALRVFNSTSGTAANAAISAANAAGNAVSLFALSAGYTSSGMLELSTGVVISALAAGMNLGTFSNTQCSVWTNNTKRFTISNAGDWIIANKTIDAVAGDSATINATAGRFRKDTTGTTFTLTNSFITANSIICLTFASDPGITGFNMYVIAAAGSATINFTTSGVAAAPTNDTDVNFIVLN